jgi:hypothetical protein
MVTPDEAACGFIGMTMFGASARPMGKNMVIPLKRD